jgi:hypothetical protein
MRCHKEGKIPTSNTPTACTRLEEHLQIIRIFARIIGQIYWVCAFSCLISNLQAPYVWTYSQNELIRVTTDRQNELIRVGLGTKTHRFLRLISMIGITSLTPARVRTY